MDLYAELSRPRLARLLKLLKLDLEYVRASGDRLFTSEGAEVIDLLGGYGSTLLGHSHPELVQTMRDALEQGVPVHAQASIRSGAARVAQKLNALIAPGDPRKFIVTLCNSGAEAVEAALKHAWMERDGVIVAIEGSFHGKTAGALAVTWNEEFKSMYPSQLPVIFLAHEETWESARAKLGDRKIAAILFEPIQGEGGIRPLPPALLDLLKRLARETGAPLIADEIQCGLYRTGEFLASHAMGIRPDYVILGKSLGGGLAKVSALMVACERYQEKFGVLHTSTFAEDELSSRVALRALELIERDAAGIRSRAARFEALIRERFERIRAAHPGVLRELRGRGFFLGIEFDFTDDAPIPTVLHTIFQSGLAAYVYSSYLLHAHGVRVGVTLSKPDTLRVEPSAFIPDELTERFLDGLEDLCAQIHQRKLVKLTRHFWNHELTAREIETVSPSRYPAVRAAVPRIAFLSHIVDETHVRLIDPFLRAIGREGRSRFLTKFAPVTGPVLYHEQLIEGANGAKIVLACYGSFQPSRFFEASHRAGDGAALAEVRAMWDRAIRDGSSFIGLGQYTSIVSKDGTLLEGAPLTTGNGLTAGYAYEGIVRALHETGRKLSDVRVGVVGAAGNICRAVAELLADEARELLLVYRKGEVTLADLRTCDVVLVGTNSAEPILLPEHLKPGAIVMDVSVPCNIDPRVFAERPDVRCYQGGRARLPLGQILRSDWLPVPRGETYACMGETICAGLLGLRGNLSYGSLSKKGVLETLEMARRVGMEAGSLRRVTRTDRGPSVDRALPRGRPHLADSQACLPNGPR